MATAALSCRLALEEATIQWPQRSKGLDGIMGDARHKGKKSDHNDGNAFDLTHDPEHGVDCAKLSRFVLADPRVKYVIFNREIYDKQLANPHWRHYDGDNPHDKHMHVSILPTARNDLRVWGWSPVNSISPQSFNTSPLYPGKPVEPAEAIKAFQSWKGLTPDGVVGPKTWSALFSKGE